MRLRKKQKKILVISGIILGVILLIGIIFSSGGFNLPFAVSGTNTLSLSKVDLQSSNSYLSGKAWLLTFSSGGLGQSYYGSFSSNEIVDDKNSATKDLTINVNFNDQECQYPVQSTSSLLPIYNIQSEKYLEIPLISPCNYEYVSKKYNIYSSNIIDLRKPSGSLDCYITYQTGQSPVGNFGQANVNQEYTISLNAGGKTSSKTISTLDGSRQGPIGDFAYGIWSGNLVSGVPCPQTTDILYRPAYVENRWIAISKQNYDRYFSNYYSNVPSDKVGLESWISNLKDSSINAKRSQSFGNVELTGNNAIFKTKLDSPIQFPLTTLYIKADVLGVYTPSPEFQILSTSSDCFRTGESGTIKVNIKNIGDEYGTYNVYAKCDSPFATTQTSTGSLNSEESRTIYLPLSASSNKKTYGNCMVYLESVSGSKSKQVNTCVDPQVTCTIPYPTKFCKDNKVAQCSNDGTITNIIKECTEGYFCENAECKIGSSIEKIGIFDSIGNFFSDLFSGVIDFFFILKLIVSLVVLIFGTIFSKDFFSSFKTLKNKEPLSWILSILVGILFAALIFVSFWIVLIIFIGYLIFIFITGGAFNKLKKSFKK